VLNNTGPRPALQLLLDAFSTAKCMQPSMLFGNRFRPIFAPSLSQRFKSGDFIFMQDSAPCSAHRAKATPDDLRNVAPNFAVE